MNPPSTANAQDSKRRFGSSFRRPKDLLAMVLIAVAVLSSPVWIWQIQRSRARHYVERINPQLKAHAVFHDIQAGMTLKPPALFFFMGSVRNDAELAAFRDFIASTHPPRPYRDGAVWVIHDSR
jgi:hypothetical protein